VYSRLAVVCACIFVDLVLMLATRLQHPSADESSNCVSLLRPCLTMWLQVGEGVVDSMLCQRTAAMSVFAQLSVVRELPCMQLLTPVFV
jgi:hypothetical protein